MLALSAAGPLEYVVMVAVLMVIATLATCVCWKGKHPSAENLGLPGRIKVTNHEDAGVTLNGTSNYPVGREDTRLSALHRELPQIPTSLDEAEARRSSSAPSEQTSELYAVVADPGARPPVPATSASAAAAAAGSGGHQPTDRPEQQQQDADAYYEQPAVARARTERQGSQPPVSSHSRNPSTTSSEIPARLAVSGGVPASQELPYMTPPVHRLPTEPAPAAQLHFSGDSVQSADSRGYTRITVREPAAELALHHPAERQAGPPSAAAAPPADNFYATVDDGSDDEMYEAIPERRRRAEQPPPPPPPPAAAGEDQTDGADGPPDPAATAGGGGGSSRAVSVEPGGAGGQRATVPPPPSVDSLRQALVHSRQASCSSVASSSTSPPPDRRSARSPLPPLPDLDQLYAKVQKTPRQTAAGSPPPPPPPPPPEPVYEAADAPLPVNYSDFEVVRDPIRRPRPVIRRESSLDPNYESIETRSRRAPAAADDDADEPEEAGYDRVRRADSAAGGGGGSDDGAGYARVMRPTAGGGAAAEASPPRRREHHYERVRRRRDEDPLYEKISGSPAASEVYDEIRWPRGPRPQPPSDAESFYESVRFGSELDTDPNYEMLPGKPESDTDELYSCIWDRRAEDPYASIKRSSSPPYESIARPPPADSDSDSDTIGYESVRAAPSLAAGDTDGVERAAPASAETALAPARDAPPDLSQLYAKVQKVQRRASGPSADVAPPIPDALWMVAPSEPDDSGAVVRMDSSSASTSQYTSASEAGTPLLPKRLDELDSPRRRRSTTSVDSGSVTQSEREDLVPPP